MGECLVQIEGAQFLKRYSKGLVGGKMENV